MRQAQTVWEHRARAAEGREGIDTAHRRKKDGLNHKSTGKSNFLERNRLAKENRKNPRCYRTSKLLSLTEERESNPIASKMLEISKHPSVTTLHLSSLNSSTKIADLIKKTRSSYFLQGTHRQSVKEWKTICHVKRN